MKIQLFLQMKKTQSQTKIKQTPVIKEVLELTKSYKFRNSEEIQKSIIKIINNSEINPSFLRDKKGDTLTHLIIKTDNQNQLNL